MIKWIKNSRIAAILLITMICILIVGLTVAIGKPSNFFNRNLIDTVWKYDSAIVITPTEEIKGAIKSWNNYENSDMIQVTFENGTIYYTHSSNVILIAK